MKQKTNVAYWERSFLDEIETKEITEGMLIWALGGAAFVVRTPEAVIYLDPYLGGEPIEGVEGMHRATAIPIDPTLVRLADAAIISHEHYDHCHEETMQALAKGTGVTFYGPESVVRESASYGLGEGRVKQASPGDRFTVKDTTVSVWPGYDAYESQAVMYLMEAGGVKALFAGDGSAGPAFDEIGAQGDLDIAMLAFGREWYMDEPGILDAAARLRPKLLLPYHWEIWRGHTGDVLEFGRLVERRQVPFDVSLLMVGDYLHYHRGGQYEKGL